jgi:hypothetical protein
MCLFEFPIHEAKFTAFTLAGSEFKSALVSCREIGWENGFRLSPETFTDWFDQEVRRFFQTCGEKNARAATENLSNIISKLQYSAHGLDTRIGDIYDNWSKRMRENFESWDCDTHISDFHRTGRQLAAEYFKGCPALIGRIARECEFEFSTRERARASSIASFAEEKKIKMVFSFQSPERPSLWYLALAFRFVHEYTAHIFPLDARVQKFSDGWMLEAAANFVQCQWSRSQALFPLSEDQSCIFERSILHHPDFRREYPVPYEGALLAAQFRAVLNPLGDEAMFDDVTVELCCLVVPPDEDRRIRIDNFLCNVKEGIKTPTGQKKIRADLVGGAKDFVQRYSQKKP